MYVWCEWKKVGGHVGPRRQHCRRASQFDSYITVTPRPAFDSWRTNLYQAFNGTRNWNLDSKIPWSHFRPTMSSIYPIRAVEHEDSARSRWGIQWWKEASTVLHFASNSVVQGYWTDTSSLLIRLLKLHLQHSSRPVNSANTAYFETSRVILGLF